jgi:SagB-type dehydrogenase family enzyme
MLPADDSRTLSHLFHLNSEPWIGPADWESSEDRPTDGEAIAGGALALPAPIDSPFVRLLARRASLRRFADRPIGLRALATLLWCAYGVTRHASTPELALYRTVPSAGALYPLDLLVLARRVEPLADGVYRYDPLGHELFERSDGVPSPDRSTGGAALSMSEALLSQSFALEGNAIVFITALFERSQRKYGPRGYRYVLLEAGQVAQNLCLSATELGLGSLCVGGYRDARLNALLGLDARREGVVYAVAIGATAHAAPEAAR